MLSVVNQQPGSSSSRALATTASTTPFGAPAGEVTPCWSLTGHTGPIRNIVAGKHWVATLGGSDTLLWTPCEDGSMSNVERLVLGAPATAMTLSCDEVTAVHAFASGKLTTFDVRTATHVSTVTAGDSIANAVAAHPTNAEIFAVGSDDGRVRVFDTRLFHAHVATAAFKDPQTALAYLPGGDIAAAGTDGIVRRCASERHCKPFLDVLTAQEVVSCLLASPSSDVVTAIALDGLITDVDLAPVTLDDSRLSNFREGPADASRQLFQAARTPAGGLVVPSGMGATYFDREGAPQVLGDRHDATCSAVAYLAGRGCILTGALDGTLVLG